MGQPFDDVLTVFLLLPVETNVEELLQFDVFQDTCTGRINRKASRYLHFWLSEVERK